VRAAVSLNPHRQIAVLKPGRATARACATLRVQLLHHAGRGQVAGAGAPGPGGPF
jgi:hypothetical protein